MVFDIIGGDMKRTLTVKQAASILQVSEETMRRSLRANRIRGMKVNRLWRVWEDDLTSISNRESTKVDSLQK